MIKSVPSNPFSIKSHRLYEDDLPVRFLRSPHQSGDFAPRGIILHDTAGRLEKGSAVDWFLQPEARASAHITVERDGSVTQQVGFDRRAWHAGKSSYRGEQNVNAFAFGIEMVNLGKCVKLRDNSLQPWFKASYRDGVNGLSFAHVATRYHGKGWWLDYTEAQILTVTALCSTLAEKYDLTFLAGHFEISPGRKTDPNPLFPLQGLRAHLFGEGDAADAPVLLAEANLRRWPSYHDNIIMVLDKGEPVQVIREGRFNTLGHFEHWYLVDTGNQQGWVQGDLLAVD
ncbi:N-acetylmuramoyl-L-alanine amidase [Cohaesibacter sp. ES.047]|uniref:N-acetylmuramoyl-L-alanine amidase n=1 Tax=Cohaesibacter sp. ES.047 TaxID=1798205 RepID=UPI000BB79C16|nr:N-acetylmuramoyl-L-alanine amidase [Cohaesibacter sp. ES.047]SNY92432.1 N-acetylmuramoyl-L-alanine amidase [Cohaesibacter sp. ES.047]